MKAVFPLLAIPSFGPKTAMRLVRELHLQNPVTVINDVAQAAKEGRIANLEGFGEKSQQALVQAIEEYWLVLTCSMPPLYRFTAPLIWTRRP